MLITAMLKKEKPNVEDAAIDRHLTRLPLLVL